MTCRALGCTDRLQRLADGQSRAAEREADLDHDARPLREHQVTQDRAVLGGQRDALEVGVAGHLLSRSSSGGSRCRRESVVRSASRPPQRSMTVADAALSSSQTSRAWVTPTERAMTRLWRRISVASRAHGGAGARSSRCGRPPGRGSR